MKAIFKISTAFAFFLLLVVTSAFSVRAAEGATVTAALIKDDNVIVTAEGLIPTDDGLYHLFAQQPYESGTQGIELAAVPASQSTAFVVPLFLNTEFSNLCKKFTLVVYQGGVPVQVGGSRYITNPEVLAFSTKVRIDLGKKGLLISSELFDRLEFNDLGINQITYNVPIGNLCNGTGVPYDYNGKHYEFNYNVIRQYDFLIPNMNDSGIQVSLVILNNKTQDLSLLHPQSRDSKAKANYYAFNTTDQAGVEKLEAIAHFLAERYAGNGLGLVDNWIIGNEVNARAEWHYMSASAGLQEDVYSYADAVRIFYNTILSVNANAKIYTSFDFEYNRSTNSADHYTVKPFITQFNDRIRSEGNIDWNVGIHPYNYPIYDPVAWKPSSLHTHSQDTPYVTMENIDVFTDFMCSPGMLSPTGAVRSIKVSEVGYDSGKNEAQQAASIVYGYMQVLNNKYLDGYILFRQQDHPLEVSQGLASGLEHHNGVHKPSYDFYKYVMTPEYQDKALEIMGAGSWEEVLSPRL